MGANLTREDYRAAMECEPLLPCPPKNACDFECIFCYEPDVIEPNEYIESMIDDSSSDISEHTPMV